MRMAMIATFKVGDNLTGFRFIELWKDWDIKDLNLDETLRVLLDGEHIIDNLIFDGNEFKGSNGVLDRYPCIKEGGVENRTTLVILEEDVDNRYLVTDYTGKSMIVSEYMIINNSEKYKVANGRVVKDGERKYVSSISGKFKKSMRLIAAESGESIREKFRLLGGLDYSLDNYGHAVGENGGKGKEKIKLLSGCRGIADRGFFGFENLKRIELNDGCNYIGRSCCSRTGIESLRLPEGVTRIGEFAFDGCRNLKVVELPNSLEYIGDGAFANCPNLKKIIRGRNSVKEGEFSIPIGVRIEYRDDNEVINSKLGVPDRNLEKDIICGYSIDCYEELLILYNPKSKTLRAIEKDLLESNVLKGLQLVKDLNILNGEVDLLEYKMDYPAYSEGKIVDGQKILVILNRIGSKGYTILDEKGEIKKIGIADVVNLVKKKGMSIANGRLVSVGGRDIIMPIVDNFDVLDGIHTNDIEGSVVGLNVSTGKRFDKQIGIDVEVKLDENDIFSVMTENQKKILKNYYTTYTIKLFEKLSAGTLLKVSPDKLNKLAMLKGNREWLFAGIWDAGVSKCSLGHALRYEYYAVPKKEGGYKSISEVINSEDKIVFGEGCAADFFSIKKEDMAKLVKIRKIMSEEIKLMADILANNKQEEYNKRVQFLNSVIDNVDGLRDLQDIFGNYLGGVLWSFRQNNMPFMKTLVLECADYINKDVFGFYSKAFYRRKRAVKLIQSGYEKKRSLFMVYAHRYLRYVARHSLEGDYSYNPFSDERDRKEIGGYNKETRQVRTNFKGTLDRMIGARKYDYTEVENLLLTIELYELIYNEVHRLLDGYDRVEIYKEIFNDIKGKKNSELTESELVVLNSILFEFSLDKLMLFSVENVRCGFIYGKAVESIIYGKFYQDIKKEIEWGYNKPYIKAKNAFRLVSPSGSIEEISEEVLKFWGNVKWESTLKGYLDYIIKKIIERKREEKRKEREKADEKKMSEKEEKSGVKIDGVVDKNKENKVEIAKNKENKTYELNDREDVQDMLNYISDKRKEVVGLEDELKNKHEFSLKILKTVGKFKKVSDKQFVYIKKVYDFVVEFCGKGEK